MVIVLVNFKTSFVDITGFGDVGYCVVAGVSRDRKNRLWCQSRVEDVVRDFSGGGVDYLESHFSKIRGEGCQNEIHHAHIAAFYRKLRQTTIVVMIVFDRIQRNIMFWFLFVGIQIEYRQWQKHGQEK